MKMKLGQALLKYAEIVRVIRVTPRISEDIGVDFITPALLASYPTTKSRYFIYSSQGNRLYEVGSRFRDRLASWLSNKPSDRVMQAIKRLSDSGKIVERVVAIQTEDDGNDIFPPSEQLTVFMPPPGWTMANVTKNLDEATEKIVAAEEEKRRLAKH